MRIISREELKSLPLDSAAITSLPESIARNNAILPVRLDGDGLYLIVPSDIDLDGETIIQKLERVLDKPFTYDYADRSDLRAVVDFFYTAIYADIQNCDQHFQYRCPKRFSELEATKMPAVRFCSACNRNVYFCLSQAELDRRATRGECVAFMLANEPQEFLGLPM